MPTLPIRVRAGYARMGTKTVADSKPLSLKQSSRTLLYKTPSQKWCSSSSPMIISIVQIFGNALRHTSRTGMRRRGLHVTPCRLARRRESCDRAASVLIIRPKLRSSLDDHCGRDNEEAKCFDPFSMQSRSFRSKRFRHWRESYRPWWPTTGATSLLSNCAEAHKHESQFGERYNRLARPSHSGSPRDRASDHSGPHGRCSHVANGDRSRRSRWSGFPSLCDPGPRSNPFGAWLRSGTYDKTDQRELLLPYSG